MWENANILQMRMDAGPVTADSPKSRDSVPLPHPAKAGRASRNGHAFGAPPAVPPAAFRTV